MKKIIFFLLNVMFISPIISMDPKKAQAEQDFFDSVQVGDVEAINELVRNKEVDSVDIKDKAGNTALMIAVQKNDILIVQELLRLGANVNLRNQEGDTVLMLAIKNINTRKKIDIVKAIFDKMPDIFVENKGQTAMTLAQALSKNALKDQILNIFKSMITAKFNKALDVENISDIKNLIPYITAESALFQVIKRNKAAVVTMILNTFPVDINTKDKDGNTLLMVAIKTNNKDIVQAILDKMPDQSLENAAKETAMILAQAIPDEASKKQIIDLLNQYGLYQAIINKNLDAVKLLVTKGVIDINQPIKGVTYLLFAIQQNSSEIVEFLLQEGAKPDIAGSDGTTPLSLAQAKSATATDQAKKDYEKIIKLLNEALAKIVPEIPKKPITPKPPIISTDTALLSSLQKFTQKLHQLTNYFAAKS